MQRPLTPRKAKGPPVGSPRGAHDEPALLSPQRRIARLRQQRREQRPITRERRQRDGLPRRARGQLHRARLALALHLHPRAPVLQPVHARAGDEPEQHVRAAVLVLRVGRLDAELVRVRPCGAARRALVVREPGEEPVVCAVLVVDLQRHEQTSAEGDRGQDCAAAEGGYTDADALHRVAMYMGARYGVCASRDGNSWLTIKPKPAWKYGLCLQGSQREAMVTD